jgi:hypothetical protein
MPAPTAVFWSCCDIPLQPPKPINAAKVIEVTGNLCIVFTEIPLGQK